MPKPELEPVPRLPTNCPNKPEVRRGDVEQFNYYYNKILQHINLKTFIAQMKILVNKFETAATYANKLETFLNKAFSN